MSSEAELKDIAEEYKNSLKELTINSHPVIATLTTIAQENIPAAKYITDAIIQRLNECIPSQKLYTLYLLDSVCKNIGSPYSILFAPHLSKIFIHCYTLVDNNTRKKMISMFKTWQSAKSSSGLPLFPAESLGKIDKFLIKATRNAPKVSPASNSIQNNRARINNNQKTSQTPPPSNIQQQPKLHQQTSIPPALIDQINKLQQLIAAKIPLNPKIENEKLGTLSQLKNLLITQALNPNDLAKISSDLQAIFATEIRELNTQNNFGIPYQQQSNFIPQNSFNNNNNNNYSNNNNNNNNNHYNDFNPNFNKDNNSNFNYSFNNNNRQFNNANRPLNTGNVSNVLSSLVANRNTSNNSNTNQIMPIVKLSSNSILKNILSKTVTKKNHDVHSTDLTPAFLLTNQSIQENVFKVDQAIKSFYTEKSIKCSNCGKRFTSSKESQIHMDWHFRINKRLGESTTICTRGDYLTPEQFAEYKEDYKESAEDSLPTNNGSSNSRTFASGVKADQQLSNSEKILSTQKNEEEHYVPVPNDSLDTNAMCNICKDILKGTWSDSKGEWLWMNAIKVDGKIYHWSCYKDARETIKKRPLENLDNVREFKKQLV